MRIPKRDLIATALVMVAGILYLLWVVDAAPPGMNGTRATGAVVLGLGFVASASAVVPGFEDLVHGNKLYLAVTSMIGLVAFGAGLQLLLNASETALGLLMAAMGVLWLIATIHHMLLARSATTSVRPRSRSERQRPRPVGVS
jgi:hypothetical protein